MRDFFGMFLAVFPRQMTPSPFPTNENTTTPGVRRFTHQRQGALFQFDIHHHYARSCCCAAWHLTRTLDFQFVGHDVVDSAIEAKGRSDDDTKTTDVFSALSGLQMSVFCGELFGCRRR